MNSLAVPVSPTERRERRITLVSVPFLGLHVAAIVGVVLVGVSWQGLLLCAVTLYSRMFGITAGYHRYFSHRTFKTSRVMQFFFALLGTLGTEKGVLWWASLHRRHHRRSDLPGDVHSAKLEGFYWAHMGWILSDRWKAGEPEKVKDLSKYPELRLLDRFNLVPPILLAVALYVIAGGWALVWGFFVSTVVLWHATYTINSLAHLWGSRRYATEDDSRNNLFLALLTLGEGWHNNHHYYQRAANQGFYWWEIDITYYILKVMSWVGLVWDIHTPPLHVRDQIEKAPPEGDA